MTECFAIAAVGSILGAALSWAAIRYLAVHSGIEMPLLQSVRLDASAFAFTVLLCAIAVVLCGAVPAWKAISDETVLNPLREDSRGASAGKHRSRSRALIVVLEMAMACVLAISAGLIVKSFIRLLNTDLGFEPHNLIAVRIDPGIEGSQIQYLETLLNRVRLIPGIEEAALTDCLPVEHDRSWGVSPIRNDPADKELWTGAHVRLVSPRLLKTMGTPLLAGRDFAETDGDGQPTVVVINQTLAKLFWPNKNAVGQQVSINGSKALSVVGVAADVRHNGPEFPAGNEIYLAAPQIGGGLSWDLLLRTNLPLTVVSSSLTAAVRELDPTLPLTKIRTMDSVMARTLSSRRMLLTLISGFAAIAVSLALVGLYGVLSYSVVQQTKEIGIRIALGADAGQVQRKIVGTTLKLTGIGLVIGLELAVIVARSFESILYGVPAFDRLTYGGTVTVLALCALAAGYIPARRASRVDPLISLRAE